MAAGGGGGERGCAGRGEMGEVGRQGERVGPTDRGGGEVPSIEGMEGSF
jgi:hypothetical protein